MIPVMSNTKTVRIRLTLKTILGIWLLATNSVLFAQQDGPPSGPPPDLQGSPEGGAPQLTNVKKRLSQMTHRYDLTPSQQEAVRPILEAERQQMTELRNDDSWAPQDMFIRMNTIHETTSKKIEAILTDKQKAKFEEDEAKMETQRRHRMEQMEGSEGLPPPPPDGGPPPN
jgi:Spy/CpxP family protein refolding chaperone